MTIRHDWSRDEVAALFERPFNELLFAAQQLHRAHHDPDAIQVSALLSIKTGACPEDCGYCPQSAHHDTTLERERLMAVDEVAEAVHAVADLGMETCVTLGMLTDHQAKTLADAGLDYYNHNLDTSPEYYPEVISTRDYADRLQTLEAVREAGLAVCCGGIVGMGESRDDRAGLLQQLANLPRHPESVPINHLVKVPGTPLADAPDLDPFELVRTVAVARVLMPASVVRLSAGREQMSDELQALCFLAGANSVFHGERLLTTPNAAPDRDAALFARLGLRVQADHEHDHSGGTDRGPVLYGNACASQSTAADTA